MADKLTNKISGLAGVKSGPASAKSGPISAKPGPADAKSGPGPKPLPLSPRPRIALLLTGLMLAACLSGCSVGGTAAQTGTGAAEAMPEEAPLPVVTAAVSRRDMDKTLTLGGLLRPQEEVVVMGGGAGSRVLRVAVSVGDYVRKGQTILTQDMRDLDIQEKNLLLSRTQLQDSYEKNKALFEAGAMAESQLTALENQIEQTDLQLDTIRLNREKMTVTASIDGIVSALPVTEGQIAAASTAVAQIVNVDKLLLDVQVGESYIMGVGAGDEMEIRIPSFGETAVTGRVKTVPPSINAQTRAYTVTVEVDNPDLAIKGGMYGELRLVVERIENALVIPQYAILNLEDGPAVFIAQQGIAQMRNVEVGLTLGEEAQILNGLQENDQVIVEGHYSATEGRRVNVTARSEAR